MKTRDEIIQALDIVLEQANGKEILGAYITFAMKDTDVAGTTMFIHGVLDLDAEQKLNIGKVIQEQVREEASELAFRKSLDAMFGENAPDIDIVSSLRKTIEDFDTIPALDSETQFRKRKIKLLRECWEQGKDSKYFMQQATKLEKEFHLNYDPAKQN